MSDTTPPRGRGRPATGRRPDIKLTLTAEGKSRLQERAEEAGLSASAWVEQVALSGKLPRPKAAGG